MTEIILPRKKDDKKPRIGVIIQARMTSARFPGKSMALLDGKPVIQHVWERAQQIRPVDVVVLAVPDYPESEPMEALAEKHKIDGFRGSELNVLERYYNAAKHYKLDVIVRITGDCPFINPRVSSEVVQLLLWRKLDYCSNVYPTRTYPKGLDTEAFTFDCLEAAYVSATWKEPGDFEHVTPFMRRTKGIKCGCTQQAIDASDQNWCVDFPEDITRLETILKEQKVSGQQLVGVSIWK